MPFVESTSSAEVRGGSWQRAVPLWVEKHVGVGCLHVEKQGGTLYTELCAGLCAVYGSGWEKRVQCARRFFCGSG